MIAPVDLFGRPEDARPAVRQLPLPFGWRTEKASALRLLISASNRELLARVLDWQRWATPIALLSGPPRSGKSLLAAHVAEQTGIVSVVHADATEEMVLFHACTAAMADHTPLLVIAEPGWQPALPDLKTRMAAAQDFSVPGPDTDLMAALLEQWLSDRHLALAPDIAYYLAQRIDRSFAALDAVSEAIVSAALADGRPLTLPFVRHVLREAGLLAIADNADTAAA